MTKIVLGLFLVVLSTSMFSTAAMAKKVWSSRIYINVIYQNGDGGKPFIKFANKADGSSPLPGCDLDSGAYLDGSDVEPAQQLAIAALMGNKPVVVIYERQTSVPSGWGMCLISGIY